MTVETPGDDFRAVGAECSNWGRWGPDDERGTLNLITDAVILDARESIRTGEVFDLGIPLGSSGPQRGQYKRQNPIHLVSYLPADFELPHEVGFVDDYLILPLQAATQWDALSHVCYGGSFYNGRPLNIVTAYAGATQLSIAAASPGVTGRGLLLDVAALHGVETLSPDHQVTNEDLDAACERQGVSPRAGDILLIRTGWMRLLLEDRAAEFMELEPGLTVAAARWCREHDIGALACDNWGVEVVPPARSADVMPVHCVCIRDVGMMLGEMFNLEELSAACQRDGVWDFFFSAPPLKVTGAVGSPINPLAIR